MTLKNKNKCYSVHKQGHGDRSRIQALSLMLFLKTCGNFKGPKGRNLSPVNHLLGQKHP